MSDKKSADSILQKLEDAGASEYQRRNETVGRIATSEEVAAAASTPVHQTKSEVKPIEVCGIKPVDLRYLIGKNGINLKRNILPQNMKYEEGEKPRVNFEIVDDKVFANIECSNADIINQIEKNIKNMVENMKKSVYYIKVPLEKHKVGKFIGAGGIYIDNMKSDIKNKNQLLNDNIIIRVEDDKFIKKGNHSFSVIYMDNISHGGVSIIKFELYIDDRVEMRKYLIDLVKENLERVYSE